MRKSVWAQGGQKRERWEFKGQGTRNCLKTSFCCSACNRLILSCSWTAIITHKIPQTLLPQVIYNADTA